MDSKEKLRISIEQFLVWVLINIGLSILPILFILLIAGIIGNLKQTAVLSSVLLFSFTLLITGIYVFFPLHRDRKWGDFLFAWAIFLSFVSALVLLSYNLKNEFEIFINDNYFSWLIIIVATVPTVIYLNYPTIETRIESKKRELLQKKREYTKKSGEKWRVELKKEGSNGE